MKQPIDEWMKERKLYEAVRGRSRENLAGKGAELMRPMATAPKNERIRLTVDGERFFLARWSETVMADNDELFGAWIAAYLHKAPPSWSDRVCWPDDNGRGEPSQAPVGWLPRLR